MVKTRALDLESHGSSPASVRAFFSFPLFNLNALSSTPSNEVFHCIFLHSQGLISLWLFQALVSH